MTRRRGTASLVASPALVGAVTVLITVIAILLAYNANRGLPFVPTLEVSVQADNGAAMTRGAEVREGGLRVGFVTSLRTVRLPGGKAAADMSVQIDNSATPLPVDTEFTIRPRSPLGLKYLEMVRGSSNRHAGDGHVFSPRQTHIPVQIDDVTRIYDGRTRRAVQGNLQGFGNALAGRGTALNRTISNLPRLFALVAPVTRNLAEPRTRLGRFFRELGDAARVVAPIADIQADLFTRTALTFEAISRDPEALKETISRFHPAFQAGIESFPVQRPFLTDTAAFARAMRPVARELRPTLPRINRALEVGIPVTRSSVDFYGRLRPTLVSLRELMRDPATGRALRGLTANATSLRPQIRYLGPYQTVCNSWNYFFTFLGEHVSQEGPFGYLQRVLVKSTGQQTNGPGSMGAFEPANGQGYQEASRPRGAPVHLHGTSYNAAVDDRGNADCENGQRGYVRRLARFAAPRFQIVTDPHMPGNQGPSYAGRRRVPRGQTFTREPETGEKHE
jgi:phospholipid/cholesterol/gamma-HCH transport system substrate-binding protein